MADSYVFTMQFILFQTIIMREIYVTGQIESVPLMWKSIREQSFDAAYPTFFCIYIDWCDILAVCYAFSESYVDIAHKAISTNTDTLHQTKILLTLLFIVLDEYF